MLYATNMIVFTSITKCISNIITIFVHTELAFIFTDLAHIIFVLIENALIACVHFTNCSDVGYGN